MYRTFLLFLFVLLPLTLRAESTALLERGTASFADGDYAHAVTTFSEAEKESPGDLRIAYNLGAAQAASGNFADAVATLRKSALAKDAELAAKSLILIGDIAVTQARLLVVPEPGETPPQDRPTILTNLAVAEQSYIEAMELQPSEAETLRRNIEQIRAWKSRAESDWNLADREKKRQELELPQRFDWLEQWERSIRTNLKRNLSDPDSPKKFQTLYDALKEQQRFLEELPPLKESVRQVLPEESFVAAVGKLSDTATVVNSALQGMRGQTALDATTTTVERLDYFKSCLSSFEAIVQDATTKQETLCEANQSGDADFDEQAWEQAFVTVRIPLMLEKAQQEPLESEAPDENLQKAKESAIQYGPEIESLSIDAAGLLQEKNAEAALSKQKRALELLREILKHLQREQDQKQDKDQDDKQDQDQNQDQSGNDSQEQQDKNDGKEQDQSEAKDEEKNSDGKEQTPQEKKKEELEKAAQMLRLIKRRQQAADERREKARTLLMQLEPVDKDW